MTVHNSAALAAGAQGGESQAGASGTQAAVTLEQLNALRADILREQNEALSGALHSRLARALEPIQTQLATLAASAAGNAKSGEGEKAGKGSSELETLRAELEAERKATARHRTELDVERRSNAIAEVLRASGCRDPKLAMRELLDRQDIKRNSEGNWVGTVKTKLGDPVEAPLADVASAYLEEHPVLLPPIGGAGSGARGTNGGARPGAPFKTLDKMSDDEVMALPAAEFDRLASSEGLGSNRRVGKPF